MAELKTAIFAGGCFWCMVKPFDTIEGIEQVVSGYTGGHVANPTYKQVCAGGTGHTEAVEITYDPQLITYGALVAIYWTLVDPTDATGQFADRGDTYRPVIFYATEQEREIAEASKQALNESGRFSDPIVVSIEPKALFYKAETYHQQFYQKKQQHYEAYHKGSGRAAFIKAHWELS